MFSMNELQQKLLTLRNELREAGRDISTEITGAQDETERAGALLADRMNQCQLDEQEEIGRHADAMAAIRARRETALGDYAMAVKAVDTRIRNMGTSLIESREPHVKVVK